MAKNVGPFFISPHCHPSVNPMRVKTVEMPQRQPLLMQQAAAIQALPKPPKPPEKPLLPYMRYSRRVWDSVKASHPDAKLWEIGKLIGQMWRELDEDTRQEVLNEYEAEKLQYVEQMKAYRNSPAYQRFLLEKSRVLAGLQSASEENEHDQNRGNPTATDAKNPRTCYSLEHIEDNNDDEDPWSIRQMALDRYERNNRLIDEIFSETKVNELFEQEESSAESPQSIVESLLSEQADFENEMERDNAAFQQRVALLQEKTERFNASLQKYLDFKISPEDEQRMFDKEYLFLQKKWEEHRMKQSKAPMEKPAYPGTQVPMATSKLLMMQDQRAPALIERQPSLISVPTEQFARHPWRPGFAYPQRAPYQAINPSFQAAPMSYRSHDMRPAEPIFSTAQAYYQQRTYPPAAGQMEQCWRRQDNPEATMQSCYAPGPPMHPQMAVRFAAPQQFYSGERASAPPMMHVMDPGFHQQPTPHQPEQKPVGK